MNPDDFKQAWQAPSSHGRVTVEADVLLSEVRRNQRQFACTVLWRDIREVGVSLLLIPVWIYLGARWSLPWTWYLTIPGLVWIAVFMLADRLRHRRQSPEPGQPLRECVEASLAQVEHQIWLLRNVHWWYLLPLALPMLIFLGHSAWNTRERGVSLALSLAVFAVTLFVVLAALSWAYWLNQRAVRMSLEPRRQELETLLASIKEETAA